MAQRTEKETEKKQKDVGNMITIRKFEAKDVARMTEIWNQVVEDGVAFPQEKDSQSRMPQIFLPHRP